jgi:RNA polymerase sigma factor (TIGR02999 family)
MGAVVWVVDLVVGQAPRTSPRTAAFPPPHPHRRSFLAERLTARIDMAVGVPYSGAGRGTGVADACLPSNRGRVTELSSLGVTRLLQRWGDGDRAAFDQLVPIVYEALRRLAHERRRGERSDLSVNTTALVHEAYLKLVDLRQARFRDRAHFLAMASRVMRRLLVDHARARKADKRGNATALLELDEALCISDENAALLTDLSDALERLEAVDSRVSQVLEQHYFGGLTLEETAEALGVSLATVKRDLRFARAWLAAELSTDDVESVQARSR